MSNNALTTFFFNRSAVRTINDNGQKRIAAPAPSALER
jgi:hypothetical protein